MIFFFILDAIYCVKNEEKMLNLLWGNIVKWFAPETRAEYSGILCKKEWYEW